MMVTGVFDAKCKACRRSVRWHGKLNDRPTCRCGYRPDSDDLEIGQQELAELFRLMFLHPVHATPLELRQMRLKAGLSLPQAANRLTIEVEYLRGLEAGITPMCETIANSMSDVYGCGV